jgi:glycosyltransferase involved in cell wall biosynthesis
MISILIPIYNSEENIFLLVEKIVNIFKNLEYEINMVNDASNDNTHEECIKLINKYPKLINYIKLRKNVGEHNAVMAGLNHSNGEWIIIMDDDFQNPPEEALKLYEYASNNKFDVIYADYEDKMHSYFRNLGSKLNDITANFILKKPKDLYLCSFKCISKNILMEIIKYKGPFPYIDGLILSITSNIGKLKLKHAPRAMGKSNYSIFKLIKLYLNIITNFSTIPIRLFSITGFIISLISFIFGIVIIFEKFFNPDAPLGYSSLIISIVFFAGIQLIFLGLIGEYIGKILKNVNQENQYNIEVKINKK